MKYNEFKKQVNSLPVISTSWLQTMNLDSQQLRNQLTLWKKKELIIQIKKSFFLLNDHDRKITPSRFFLANELYRPSYISMETALSFYGFIPEKVIDMTSVSTKKTAVFANQMGTFRYQHIKTNCFTGFIEKRDESNLPYFIAIPEKAFVDFCYLNRHRLKSNPKKILLESYRLQNFDRLQVRKVKHYTGLVDSVYFSQLMREVINA